MTLSLCLRLDLDGLYLLRRSQLRLRRAVSRIRIHQSANQTVFGCDTLTKRVSQLEPTTQNDLQILFDPSVWCIALDFSLGPFVPLLVQPWIFLIISHLFVCCCSAFSPGSLVRLVPTHCVSISSSHGLFQQSLLSRVHDVMFHVSRSNLASWPLVCVQSRPSFSSESLTSPLTRSGYIVGKGLGVWNRIPWLIIEAFISCFCQFFFWSYDLGGCNNNNGALLCLLILLQQLDDAGRDVKRYPLGNRLGHLCWQSRAWASGRGDFLPQRGWGQGVWLRLQG